MAKTKSMKAKVGESIEPAGETEVTVCRRRGDRRGPGAKPAKATLPLAMDEDEVEGEELEQLDDDGQPRKVQRRRQIDPTTCERDYTGDEIEFMHALDAYKRSSGRMFPTCSEILEVVRGLGYAKPSHLCDVMPAESGVVAESTAS